MSLREDLQMVADKEGYGSIKSFLTNFLQIRRNSCLVLKYYLENKYRRYYSLVHIKLTCGEYIEGKLNPVKIKTKGSREKGGFCHKKNEEHWNKIAEVLKFKNVEDMLNHWKGSEVALAKILGISTFSLYYRRIKTGIRRNKKGK